MELFKRKPLTLMLALIAILVPGYFLYMHAIDTNRQGNELLTRPYRSTLSGEYVCLPYKEGMELVGGRCAFGIRTDTNDYYAIDFADYEGTLPQFSVGDRIEAKGTVTPLAAPDERQWSEYPIKGLFSAASDLTVLPK